ncbi:MAG TPA: response regulator [Candidatus Melainabacteria bacterium]|nr:response regulator [Candidatus Melainabacteria bacterium]
MSRHILIASKDKRIGELTKEAVRSLDYNVVVAADLSLALYLANKNMPDLIVTDEELINGTGFDLLSELSTDEELGVIPILFIAKNGSDSQKARDLGAKKVIVNPKTIDELFLELMPHLTVDEKSPKQRPEYSPE